MDMAYRRAKEGVKNEKNQWNRIKYVVKWKYFSRVEEISSTNGRQARPKVSPVFEFLQTLIQRFFERFKILINIKRRYTMADDKPDPT
jgi:hypothetical protein